MKETDKTDKTEPKWVAISTNVADVINKLRIVPRLIVGMYGTLFWYVSVWFMALEDPTATQAAFVSTVVGAGAAMFNFYVNSTNKNN